MLDKSWCNPKWWLIRKGFGKYLLQLWVVYSTWIVLWGLDARYHPISFFDMAQFCSVVVITFALHAKGRRFEPGWNYFYEWTRMLREYNKFRTLRSIPRFRISNWKFCIVGESNPGLPRGRREFYHWTNNARQCAGSEGTQQSSPLRHIMNPTQNKFECVFCQRKAG